MTLDYPSILFFLALNNLFIIALFVYQYISNHKQWYLLLVTLGITFQTISFIIFNQRDSLSYNYVVRITNFLLISSFAMSSFGLISFNGKVRKKLLLFFSIAVFLFYTATCMVEQNQFYISIIRISSCSFFYGICSYYLFFNRNKYKFSILLSVIIFAFTIFQITRTIYIYRIGPSFDFFEISAMNNWFLVASIFVINGHSIGFIMLLKEIDQKKIIEKNIIIQKNQLKLKKLNQTQNKLFSIIAHDLRSPFNNILGLSELCLDNNRSKSEEYIGLINSTAQNTLNLLDNLLNWVRTQKEEINLNVEKVNLSKVINKIIILTTSLSNAKNINIQYSSVNDIDVYTDENILSIILRNLISNAIKFTNIGGEINISTTICQKHIEISIADNGVGMSAEMIHEIFTLSNNTSSLGTMNEKGSGLGLLLCKEFVEKLNGKIWVESEKGKGSNFIFTIPLNIS